MRPQVGNQKRQTHLNLVGFLLGQSNTGSLFEPPTLDNLFVEINHLFGGLMRDYTYIGGARFTINNIFRSLRFDVDRLDLSWVEDEKPEFTRGLRVVDNDESNTVTLDGEDADNLIFSLAHAFNKQDGFENFRAAVDEYLKVALATKQYLITGQKKDPEGKPEVTEAVIH